jgi:pimeloyl-ACP methyl ester carboxylesterase
VEESRLGLWLRRIGAAVAIGLIAGLLIGAFRGSTVIANDLLTPEAPPLGPEFEIQLVGAGRIVLPRSDITEQDGIWGISNGTGGYGQITGVISTDAETVERSFRTLAGRFIAGEMVTFDAYAAGENPADAFALEYNDVRVPGELGVNPAWYVDGVRDTWVIVVHGEGLDERRQALRILPAVADGGFPSLVITYRNDAAAPDAGGFYRWGLSEWQDIEAAIGYGRNRGAEDFILYGFGMGANIVTMHLHQSDSAALVRGAVLDSIVPNLGSVVDDIARERGIPAVVSSAAKAVARIRFGLEWSELDQMARAVEFDVPLLLLHGTEDDVAPIATVDAFAEALPGSVTYERFEGAERTELWNSDPERYNAAVLSFLIEVADAGG